MTEAFDWQGRVDSEEHGDSRRWHQHVKHVKHVRAVEPGGAPAAGSPACPTSRGGVTLIGFAVDEGVRRNAGRTGAAAGPRALRGALAGLPVLDEPAIWDAGDVGCDGSALEAAQDVLADRVAATIAGASLPLVLGGGHEVAWGSFQGIVRARPDLERILVVNFDAHFDLRQASQANSGTPFRQIGEWCRQQGRPFGYHVLGISRFANTRALFDRAAALGVHYVLDEALQGETGVAAAQARLLHDLDRCQAVYLTVCLDVLPGGQAPGVSAPAPLGVPLATVLTLMRPVLASGKLVAADIAELNPGFDRDGLTARVAARIAATIAREARPLLASMTRNTP